MASDVDSTESTEPDPAPTGDSTDPEFLRAVFADMGAGVFTVDDEGTVTGSNPLAERLLGHGPGELADRRVHDAICFQGPDGQEEPAEACPVLRPIRTGRPTGSDDDAFVRRDGSILPVTWTSTPLHQEGRVAGAVVVFRDATVRQEARARRAALYARGRQARQEAEDAHETLAWLARVTDELTSTLDAKKSLEGLVRLLSPHLADWAALDVAAGPGRLRRVAWPRGEEAPSPREPKSGMLPRFAPGSPTPLARLLAGAGTRLLTDVDAAGPGCDALDEEQRELFAGLGAASALLVPLRSRGNTLGAMTLVRTDPASPFTEDEVVLAEEVARRAALSVDNARMYGQQADIAAVLQRSLLTDLPHIEDLELAASYRPAHQEAEIGGDWYDAFRLPDGDLAVVVGDVVGHDLQAASRMGALRNMLRALAVDRARAPGEVLQRLDAAMGHLDVADSATAVCSFLRPVEAGHWRFTWSNAGHPPPLLIAPDGRTEWLEQGHSLLLGVEPDEPRPSASMVLSPGCVLLLYTDGLVESRTRPIDDGLERLRHLAAAEAHRPMEELCGAVIDALGDPSDDITVIAVRVPWTDQPV
jgi:PAS domain S-box-containing protein